MLSTGLYRSPLNQELVVSPNSSGQVSFYQTARWMKLRHVFAAFAILFIGLGFSGGVQAETVYEVGLYRPSTNGTESTSSPIPPHTDNFSANFGNTSATSSATSTRGALTSQLEHHLTPTIFGLQGGAHSFAEFSYDDVIFFDIANPTATGTIAVSVEAFYSGDLFNTGLGIEHINASFFMSVNIGPASFNLSPIPVTGPFSGSFITGTVNVPLNTPLLFKVRSTVGTAVFGSGEPGTNSVSVFANTQMLGPIFNLPEGYSVDSLGGGILNNQFVPLVLLGDVNMDGIVNLLDVTPFITHISNGTFQEEADINQDGVVNLLDVDPFIVLLSDG